MLIDCNNLEAELPGMLEAIAAAEFVAFDTEFTGLHCDGLHGSRENRIAARDSNEKRFAELRVPAEHFRVSWLFSFSCIAVP